MHQADHSHYELVEPEQTFTLEFFDQLCDTLASCEKDALQPDVYFWNTVGMVRLKATDLDLDPEKWTRLRNKIIDLQYGDFGPDSQQGIALGHLLDALATIIGNGK